MFHSGSVNDAENQEGNFLHWKNGLPLSPNPDECPAPVKLVKEKKSSSAQERRSETQSANAQRCKWQGR
jgi:hypothetical protein